MLQISFGHFDNVTAGFQDQRRVGRDAVDEAQVIQLPDFIDIGCIDKNFMEFSLSALGRRMRGLLCCFGVFFNAIRGQGHGR